MEASTLVTMALGAFELEILERMDDAVVVVDRAERVAYCNSAARRAWPDASLATAEETLADAVRSVLATGESRRVAHRLGRIDAAYESHVFALAGGAALVMREVTASNAHVRAALAASSIGTYRVDLRSGLDMRDATLNAMFGLDAEPSVARLEEYVERIHAEDRPRVVSEIDRAIREGGRYAFTFRVVRDDGTRWLRDVGRVTLDAEGPVAMLGAVTDVTRDREEHEAVQASEARYRSLVLATHPLVWTTDASGEVVEPQPLWCAFTGQRFDAALGHGWLDMIHPSDRDAFEQVWAHALRTPRGHEMPVRIRKHDGTYRHVSMYAAPVTDDEGRAREWIASAMDITDRITARQRVEQSFAQLARASRELASSIDLTSTLDHVANAFVPAQADVAAVYLARGASGFEPVACALAGLSREEVRARALASLREAPTDLTSALAELARTQTTIRHVATHALDGFGVKSVSLVPLVARDRLLGVVLLARPSDGTPLETDWLLAEEIACRAAVAIENAELFELSCSERERVEEANRAKDEFLAVVSHELRTPLNAVLGWAKMLMGDALDEGQRQRALSSIERNARLQAQLIEDLLDISRIITGKLRIKLDRVDLREVAAEAIEVVRPAAVAKRIQLEVTLPEAPAMLVGDAERLQQILWNVLSNAVKFTPEAGQVCLEMAHEPNGICVRVSDSGRGIAPEFLPHMFDRFRQEGGGTTRKHGGLGLGLAIARHLLELHGGTIEAASPGVGHGATFVLHLASAPRHTPLPLPFETRLEAPPASARRPRPSVAGIRVLVVDDDADARELMESILASSGAEVRTASCSEEALAAVQANGGVHVVVSDIAMPGEDGYRLIERVRALPAEAGGATPAIALTAYSREEDRRRAISAGFTMHMCKPVEPTALLSALRSLAESESKRA